MPYLLYQFVQSTLRVDASLILKYSHLKGTDEHISYGFSFYRIFKQHSGENARRFFSVGDTLFYHTGQISSLGPFEKFF